MFSHFYINVNPDDNWNIISVPANVADDNAGMVAGKSINELLLSGIPAENKTAVLVYAYGFKESEAAAMVPQN